MTRRFDVRKVETVRGTGRECDGQVFRAELHLSDRWWECSRVAHRDVPIRVLRESDWRRIVAALAPKKRRKRNAR